MNSLLKALSISLLTGVWIFETILFLLEKTRDSPIFDSIEKVDSQKFYKSNLWRESWESKYRMDTIVKY